MLTAFIQRVESSANNILRWRQFPFVFQFLLLACLIVLAFVNLSVLAPDGTNAKLFAKSNLLTLLVWGIWWPAMIWVAVLFGRLWCAICPLELVSNISERIAGRLRMPQAALVRWIRTGALSVLGYLAIQMLVFGMEVHRVPSYTSLFILFLIGFSAMVGFFWKDRAFCRGFCPVNMLLKTYGRHGLARVRSHSADVCLACRTKECVAASNRKKVNGRSCPSLLNPPLAFRQDDCLLCGQCIKACRRDNLGISIRQSLDFPDPKKRAATWPMTIFIMIVSGFVLSELASESRVAHDLFRWIPSQMARITGFGSGWLEGVWTLVVVPCLLWGIVGGVAAKVGREPLTKHWRHAALTLAVMISAGHMAKAFAKVSSWIGFLPLALDDPSGLSTVEKITSGVLSPPEEPAAAVRIGMALILLVIGATIAWRTDPGAPSRHAHVVTYSFWTSVATVTVLAWAL